MKDTHSIWVSLKVNSTNHCRGIDNPLDHVIGFSVSVGNCGAQPISRSRCPGSVIQHRHNTLEPSEIYIVKYIITRNVLLSAQMGERASVVLICIITSRYNEVK